MKIVRLIVILAVVGGLGFYLFRKNQRAADEEELGYPGYAEGELVYVSSALGGELQELKVRRGDQVGKDSLLFQLDDAEETAERAQAEELMMESNTQLDKARQDFDRAKSLRDKRVTSPEDYDAAAQALLGAQHTVAARKKALDQADWRLGQKKQDTPASGLVYDTYYRPGEWVPAGTPVVSLLPPEYMKVRFFVPEGDLGKLPIGTGIEILSDGVGTVLPGKVSFVSPKAEYTLPIIYSRENRGKLVFLVEGSLAAEDAGKLHPGAPIEVRIAENGK